jgi:SagB-type dehydrogenase family enzyme
MQGGEMANQGRFKSLFLLIMIGMSCGHSAVIKLPPPLKTGVELEHCISARRSVRDFTSQLLTQEELSTILWACQGITDESRGFRAAPSAGATYPLEVYLVLPDGLFNYQPDRHELIKLKDEDLRRKLARAALAQGFIAQAPVDIVIAAVPERTTRRYGERGLRYIWLEMGHAAQNIHLQAVALKLGSVPVGAFNDEKVKEILGLSEEMIVGYIIPVGHPR